MSSIIQTENISGSITDDLGAGGTVIVGGWVYLADVSGQGAVTVTSKTYQDAGSTVLQSAVISGLDVNLLVRASYPLVSINGAPAVELTQDIGGGFYAGTIPVTLVGSGAIAVGVKLLTPDNDEGVEDNAVLTLDAPPELLTLSFTGGYPGAQTELKAGDTFQLTGTTDKNADAVQIADSGAMISELKTFAAGTSFTVTGTIADRGTTLQALAASVQARDAVTGALGTARATNELGGAVDGQDLVNLNNLYPSGSWGAPSYPPSQGALKDAEAATLSWTDADFDTVAYTSPGGELAITNPNTSEPTKTVNRIGGTYNDSVDNLRATLTRAANAAVTVVDTLVKIADANPVVTVAEAAARLRSGGNDGTAEQFHVITVTSDQEVAAAPDITPEAGGGRATRGIFTGAWASGDNKVWTRNLGVHDDDGKGTFTWQAGAPIVTNLAGRTAVAITGDATYTLGGFVARSLTFGPFATSTPMAVEVVDFSKLTAGIFTATNQPALKQPIGTPPSVTDGYTIDAVSINPTSVIWLDTPAAASNSSGTAQITDVEETV